MTFSWANIARIELLWTIPAILAFFISLGGLRWIYVRFQILRRMVKSYPYLYRAWGPRWNFSIYIFSAFAAFAFGWLGYVAVGVTAMMVPPPLAESNRQASDILAYVLIGMEICHAVGMGLLWASLRALAGASITPDLTFWRGR